MDTRLLPHDQPIAQTLMIPFVMVVNNKFLDGPSQGPLAEQNEPLQAGFLDGSDKAFGIGHSDSESAVAISRTGSHSPEPFAETLL
jgi:hypothetical protein